MKIEHYIILMVILVGFVTMPLLIPTIKTTQTYSIFNTQENGCSNFLKLMHNSNTIKPLIYPYSNLRDNSILFIIGPDVEFSEDEGHLLRNYVYAGNILVVADDFNKGNSLLKSMNVSNRFLKKPLYDLAGPIAIGNSNIFDSYVVLNNPTSIDGDGKTILSSSSSSNVNKYPIPLSERSYPIIIEKKYGNGKIILISDPDLFTNTLFTYNNEFLKSYFNYTNKIIYIDEFHHSDVNPQNIVTITVKNNILPTSIMYLSIFILLISTITENIGNIFNKILSSSILRKVISKIQEKSSGMKSNKKSEIFKMAEKYNMSKDIVYKILDKIK
jgi:hypothetical protein